MDPAPPQPPDAGPATPGETRATPLSPTAALTGKQRRHLRALGHHLSAVVQVGHEGLSPAVVLQARAQLEVHELIKVKLSDTAPLDRKDGAQELAAATGAHVAQVLGRTFLLYRRRKEKPGIVLP